MTGAWRCVVDASSMNVVMHGPDLKAAVDDLIATVRSEHVQRQHGGLWEAREYAALAAQPVSHACAACGHPKSDHGDDKTPQWERACRVGCGCFGFAEAR